MLHRSPAEHPEELHLLRAMRCSPLDPRTWLLRWHLARCAKCQDLCRQAEASLFALFTPCERALERWIGDDRASRQRLLSNMRSALAASSTVTPGRLSPLRPGILVAGLLAASCCLIYIASTPPRQPALTASEVLAQAVTQDNLVERKPQLGVIFHRVEITAGSHRFEWSSYRDRQGKRKPHVETVAHQEGSLGQRLAAAGISEDDPLSVNSYRTWRNHLNVFSDNIVHSSSGLFIITTSVPANSPAQIKTETLTLRGDYHPIRRTVVFQDSEEIQVAELDYRLMNWDEVHPGVFEDAGTKTPIPAPLPTFHEKAAAPELSDSDLILAELQARLELSQESLDVNEHVEMLRRPDGVRIRGFVSSPEKKSEIHTALSHVPHVVEELSSPSDPEPNETASVSTQPRRITILQSVSSPSPLLLYWKNQNRRLDELPRLTANMLDAALRINQQSRALRDLMREFDPNSALDSRSHEMLRALLQDHANKLRTALSHQRETLKTLGAESLASLPKPDATTLNGSETTIEELDQRATRSMSLSRELNTADESGKHLAEPLLDELTRESITMAALLDRISSLNH